jgi:hypothetical protein
LPQRRLYLVIPTIIIANFGSDSREKEKDNAAAQRALRFAEEEFGALDYVAKSLLFFTLQKRRQDRRTP